MNTDAIAYIRCSREEQVQSGLGLAAQRDRIDAYARLKGLRLLDVIADEGVSGGKALGTRPGGAKLLDSLSGRKPRARAVVMLKLDRGFRNATDCLAVVDEWDRRGVALHITDLGGNAIDTTSAAGRFMLTVLAGAAEMERNLVRERTKAALGVKRAKGERRSRWAEYGHDHTDDGRIVENPDEQAIIREIVEMRDKQVPIAKIARTLTKRGIPTKNGAAWSRQAIYRIIRRRESATT